MATGWQHTKLKWGATVSVTIKTSPGAECVLSFQTPDGRESTANGLGPQSADEAGRCVWIWKISAGTKPGIGQVYIEVDGQGEDFPITIK